MEWGEAASVDDPLAQRILDIIYQDPDVRRGYKESLTDWILDPQPRTAPLDREARVQDRAAHQPALLHRRKINGRITEELARALESLDRT
jgi:hypothetical protein